MAKEKRAVASALESGFISDSSDSQSDSFGEERNESRAEALRMHAEDEEIPSEEPRSLDDIVADATEASAGFERDDNAAFSPRDVGSDLER